MRQDKVRQIAVCSATIVILIANTLISVLPLEGFSADVGGGGYPIYFVPASYVFFIWVVIYLGLIAYTIFQARSDQRANASLRKIGWWYVASIAGNLAWILCWYSNHQALSLLATVFILFTLVNIYYRLEIGLVPVSRGMNISVHIPFSIYLGWISVSGISNASVVLVKAGWNGWGLDPKVWAVVMIVFAVLIAELTAYNRKDLVYLAVYVWVFIGIGVRSIGVTSVSVAAFVASAVVAIIALITSFVVRKKQKKPLQTILS